MSAAQPKRGRSVDGNRAGGAVWTDERDLIVRAPSACIGEGHPCHFDARCVLQRRIRHDLECDGIEVRIQPIAGPHKHRMVDTGLKGPRVVEPGRRTHPSDLVVVGGGVIRALLINPIIEDDIDVPTRTRRKRHTIPVVVPTVAIAVSVDAGILPRVVELEVSSRDAIETPVKTVGYRHRAGREDRFPSAMVVVLGLDDIGPGHDCPGVVVGPGRHGTVLVGDDRVVVTHMAGIRVLDLEGRARNSLDELLVLVPAHGHGECRLNADVEPEGSTPRIELGGGCLGHDGRRRLWVNVPAHQIPLQGGAAILRNCITEVGEGGSTVVATTAFLVENLQIVSPPGGQGDFGARTTGPLRAGILIRTICELAVTTSGSRIRATIGLPVHRIAPDRLLGDLLLVGGVFVRAEVELPVVISGNPEDIISGLGSLEETFQLPEIVLKETGSSEILIL